MSPDYTLIMNAYSETWTTDTQRGNSLHCTAEKALAQTPNFSSMAEAYFGCHIGPIFQISLIYTFTGFP